MGQISYPILNRFGYSMYWRGMWDNVHTYNRFFLKSLFFNFYFSSFFNYFLSIHFFFLSTFFYKNIKNARNFYKNDLNKINLDFLKKINKRYEEKKEVLFSGRLYILIFNKWYISSLTIYLSSLRKEKSKQIKIEEIHTNYFYKLFFLKQHKHSFNFLNKLKRVVF